MGFRDKVKDVVSGGGSGGGFYFQCTSCKAEFEAETDDRTEVTCPRCGGEIVRTLPDR